MTDEATAQKGDLGPGVEPIKLGPLFRLIFLKAGECHYSTGVLPLQVDALSVRYCNS